MSDHQIERHGDAWYVDGHFTGYGWSTPDSLRKDAKYHQAQADRETILADHISTLDTRKPT